MGESTTTIELFGYKVKLSLLLCTLKNGVNVILHFVNDTEPTKVEILLALIQYVASLEKIIAKECLYNRENGV